MKAYKNKNLLFQKQGTSKNHSITSNFTNNDTANSNNLHSVSIQNGKLYFKTTSLKSQRTTVGNILHITDKKKKD